MSIMGNVSIELAEIGYKRVFYIESIINGLDLTTENRVRILQELYKKYGVTANTALMITSGARTHKCSKMLREEEDVSDY